MLADVLRRFAMLSPGQRLRWAAVAPVGLFAAALEGLGGALVFALLTGILEPAPAGSSPVMALIGARLGGHDQQSTVMRLAAGAAGVHIAKNVLLLVLAAWRTRLVAYDTAAMSTRLLRAYMSAPWAFHLQRGSAGLIESIRESTRPFFNVFEAASTILTEAAVVLALAIVAIVAAPAAVTAVAAVSAVAVAVALRVARDFHRRGGTQQFELGAALYRHVQHSLGAVKEVRILGRTQFFVDAFENDARECARLDTRRGALNAVPRLLLETMFVLGLLGLIVYGGRQDPAGVLPLASLYAYAGFRFVPAAHRVAEQTNSLRWSLGASESLAADLRLLEPVVAHTGPADRLDFRHEIRATGVSFSYQGAPAAQLRDVTLSIRRGESVAIVGATGAGKTTLVDILIGLLAPSHGRVTVDGVPIESRPSAWQAAIGYVPQSPFLLDDTLRRNLAPGMRDEDVDQEALARAVHIARLDAVVRGLPEGLETMIGERGIRLSGGERQRVAIARALYRDPALLIFDEATSALDPGTEREVTEAIDLLRGARTVIVIAHRLTTVERCDRILLLSEGSIVASGSYGELAAGNEAFRRLAALG